MSGHGFVTTADQLCPIFPGEIIHGLHVFRLGLGKRTERVQNIASIRRANIYQLLTILFDVVRSSNRENARRDVAANTTASAHNFLCFEYVRRFEMINYLTG